MLITADTATDTSLTDAVMTAVARDAVGLGVPFWLPDGGENHPDAIVMEQSVWLDGRQVVRDGMAPSSIRRTWRRRQTRLLAAARP